MAKELKPLIINAPRTGIAQSAHVGVSDMRNLDISSIPGIVKLNNILAKVSGSAVVTTVKWIVRDPVTPANFYAVDSGGEVYVSTNSGASFAALGTQPTAGGAGQGLAIWKDYLLCPRATAMDLYGPLSSSPAWRNSWAGLTMATDSLWHPLLVSELDDKIYGGAGRYVFTIEEVAGQTFLWSDTGTYTATAQALDLPTNLRVKCLAELGNDLMIGTWKGTALTQFKLANIYPWDGTSPTYRKPIVLKENGVNAMLNDGGYLYVQAGIDGMFYKSNGYQATPIAKIPQSIVDTLNGKYVEVYPGAFISYKGKPTFGLSAADVADGLGVYSLMETVNGTIVNFEHSISEETMGSANPLIIGALLGVKRDQLLVGWRDNATYGIDLTNTASFLHTTAYTKAYFDSPLYRIGTNLKPRAFSEIEILLAKELATGEGLQIKYRVNLTDSFTTLRTYIFSGTKTTTNKIIGGVTSDVDVANIPASDTLQIRVELLGSSTTSPQFHSLTLK